jgi:ribosomal 50S subunit-recycling heat shock protein
VRLDLFLKASRLVKRRTVARELCDAGRVLVNGHEAKPARVVRQGDAITLTYSSRILELEVVGTVTPFNRKAAPEDLYKVRSEKRMLKDWELWSENRS